MSETPDWLRLLQAWQGRGKRGLTLPFLVGAIALQRGELEASRVETEELLKDIQSKKLPGRAVEVGWCWDLKAPILSVVQSPHSGLVFGSDLKRNFKCDDPDELAGRLLAGAELPIREGNFSRIPEEWGARWDTFTPLDRELIKRAFQR
ncbi:MAG TPA: hypothetical protein VMI06_08170 [Terriglobia bacterium]|nr:hypothetical protein [Terriglobia bacterium]